MKTILILLFAGFLFTLSSCEKCAYCRCYGYNYKYCQKDHTPENYEAIKKSCVDNPYCGWFPN